MTPFVILAALLLLLALAVLVFALRRGHAGGSGGVSNLALL